MLALSEAPLDKEAYLLEDIFEPFTNQQVDLLRKDMIQDLPFNKNVQVRCQKMWNGCKKLRQLCISSTQYDACTAYVHTIGINMPITSPPDDACTALRQPDQLHRIWVLPASKCSWEDYKPKSSVMLLRPSLFVRAAYQADSD